MTNDLAKALDANSHLFEGVPEEALNVLLDIFIKRHRLGLDYEGIYELLAFELLEKTEADFPVRDKLEDTPLKRMRSASISLLRLFYSEDDIRKIVRIPMYEPDSYASLNPQNKAVVEIAKMMLLSTSDTEIFDFLEPDPKARKELYLPTLGKLGWAGLRSIEGAPKGAVNRKENNKERENWLIEWALKLDESSNGRLSITEISRRMRKDDNEWQKEATAKLSADRIYKIIGKAVRSKRKLATRA